nr:MAG TPA: hypothetical protein [Caudoviricetes sp.]
MFSFLICCLLSALMLMIGHLLSELYRSLL